MARYLYTRSLAHLRYICRYTGEIIESVDAKNHMITIKKCFVIVEIGSRLATPGSVDKPAFQVTIKLESGVRILSLLHDDDLCTTL